MICIRCVVRMVRSRTFNSVLQRLEKAAEDSGRNPSADPVYGFLKSELHSMATFERTHGTIRYGRRNLKGIKGAFAGVLWNGPKIPGRIGSAGGTARGQGIERDMQNVLTAKSKKKADAVAAQVQFREDAAWALREMEEKRGITVTHCQLPFVDVISGLATLADFVGVSINKDNIPCLWIIELKTHLRVVDGNVPMKGPLSAFADTVKNRAISQVVFAMYTATRAYKLPRDAVKGLVLHAAGGRSASSIVTTKSPMFKAWETGVQRHLVYYASTDAARLRRNEAARKRRAEKKRKEAGGKGTRRKKRSREGPKKEEETSESRGGAAVPRRKNKNVDPETGLARMPNVHVDLVLRRQEEAMEAFGVLQRSIARAHRMRKRST